MTEQNPDNLEIDPTVYDQLDNPDELLSVVRALIQKIDESTDQTERLAFGYEVRDFTNEYYEQRFLKGENSK